jgi:hypothetical protein
MLVKIVARCWATDWTSRPRMHSPKWLLVVAQIGSGISGCAKALLQLEEAERVV